MNHDHFIEAAKLAVREYTNQKQNGLSDNKQLDFDVYVVWSVKVLQNSKALLSTTLFDGMYFEATLNGDKDEIYFDAYEKTENIVIPV